MTSTKFLTIGMLIISTLSFSQFGGNQVYSNSNQYGYQYSQSVSSNPSILSNDSILTITTNVLLHQVADQYVLTVGMNQEALTVLDCNTLINERISRLKKKLTSFGIEEEDVYVDFVTQTKIYDYEVEREQATQIETGFEIKKNINLRFKNIDLIDVIIESCSEEKIYDIINLEYIVDDINEVYEKLMSEAMQIAENRKNTFLQYSSKELAGEYRLVGDNFNSTFPKTQYKQYEAKESSTLSVYSKNYNEHYIRKEARKNKTFYYQGIPVSGFDKVIGHDSPDISVQHSLTITVQFEIK